MSAYTQLVSELTSTLSKRRRMIRTAVANQVRSLSFHERVSLERELHLRDVGNIRARVNKQRGYPKSIEIKFPTQLWFVESGTRKGIKKDDPRANPRPILGKALPPHIEKMADEVSAIIGDSIFFDLPNLSK